VEPRTTLETTLADIWARVLKAPRVGTTDNFFSLGGDSILSIQIVARARQAGVKLTPSDYFPSARRLPNWRPWLNWRRRSHHRGRKLVGRKPWNDSHPAVVFLNRNSPNETIITNPLLLRVHPSIDESIAKRVLKHVVDRHDGLRLRYAFAKQWRQEYADKNDDVFLAGRSDRDG